VRQPGMDPAEGVSTEIPHLAGARSNRGGVVSQSDTVFRLISKNKSNKVVRRDRTDLQRQWCEKKSRV